MILRTNDNQDFNSDKIWGIEIGFVAEYDTFRWKKDDILWSSWKSYESQLRMLQALKQLKEGSEKYKYRPIHIDYIDELENLNIDSKRRYNLNKLLL